MTTLSAQDVHAIVLGEMQMLASIYCTLDGNSHDSAPCLHVDASDSQGNMDTHSFHILKSKYNNATLTCFMHMHAYREDWSSPCVALR